MSVQYKTSTVNERIPRSSNNKLPMVIVDSEKICLEKANKASKKKRSSLVIMQKYCETVVWALEDQRYTVFITGDMTEEDGANAAYSNCSIGYDFVFVVRNLAWENLPESELQDFVMSLVGHNCVGLMWNRDRIRYSMPITGSESGNVIPFPIAPSA